MNFGDIISNLPAWATTDEAKAYVAGFVVGASVRIFRSAMRWMKRIASDGYGLE